MKKLKVFGLIAVAIGLTSSGDLFAQSSPVTGKNIIKYNLTATAIGHYAIQYERVINPKQSFAIGFGISPNVSLPFKQTLMDAFSDNADAKSAIESTTFTKFTITPEYRFYIGKKEAPGGFYVAPFARYTNMKMSQKYKFTENGINHIADVTGRFNGVGAGVVFGAQWLLGKKENIVLDFWFAGPFAGVMKATFEGFDDKLINDPAAREKEIEDFKIPLWTVDATVTNVNGKGKVDANLKGPFYGFRTLGLSIGYRF